MQQKSPDEIMQAVYDAADRHLDIGGETKDASKQPEPCELAAAVKTENQC